MKVVFPRPDSPTTFLLLLLFIINLINMHLETNDYYSLCYLNNIYLK